MKIKELSDNFIFSNFTSVKLVINGNVEVFKGYWYQKPAEYADYEIEKIIPIKHPDDDNLGMASILIYEG